MAGGNDCIFEARKDTQERNRELRIAEKALFELFRVLRNLQAGDLKSSAELTQISQLARNNSESPAFARDLSNLHEKMSAFDFANYDGASSESGSGNFHVQKEGELRGFVG